MVKHYEKKRKTGGRQVRVSGISLYPDQWATIDEVSKAVGGRSKAVRFMVELVKVMDGRVSESDVAEAISRAGRQNAPAN